MRRPQLRRDPGMDIGMDIGRDLVAASATPLVLAILAEGESYGYAIVKQAGALSGGRLRWTEGMLYPVLHRLERLGQIRGRWSTAPNGRRRKYYGITDEGRRRLARQKAQWLVVDATLRRVWSPRGGPHEPPPATEGADDGI